MPILQIPLTSLDLSVDKATESASYGQLQQDGYFKKYFSPSGQKYIWCKRPGLIAWADTAESANVFDIYYHARQDKIVAVLWSTGKVFKIAPSTGTCTEITGTAAMDGTSRPSFVDGPGGNGVYISTGEQIGAFSLVSGTGSMIADADAPTSVVSIATLNNSLIAARLDSTRFDWSDAGAFNTWSGLYANTSVTPAYNRGMRANAGYLYFFKDDIIEIWRDDGTTFVRESQGTIPIGTRNNSSIRLIDGSFYFMDNNMDYRRLTGMQLETISNPYLAGLLANYTNPEINESYHLKWDGKDFYICAFDNNDNCLVYDIELSQWYQWGAWDGDAYLRWGINGICTAQNAIWYAGDLYDGLVHKIGGTQDLGVDIRTMLRTDFIDHGKPNQYKLCNEIVLIFKRASTASTPKTMQIRYRDDGSQTWSSAITANIEISGSTELRVTLRRLGRYRRRMWEFVFPDASQAALLEAWEDLTYGR